MPRLRVFLGLCLIASATLAAAACGGGGRHFTTTTAAAPITSLPVIACKTTNAAGSSQPIEPHYLPQRAPLPVGLSQALAAKLAWYEGAVKEQADLKVLGPRGWSCGAGLGADGGWSMAATGSKAKQTIQIGASYNGPGASTACLYFPSAVSDAPFASGCRTPHGTTVSFVNDHLATIASTMRGGGVRLVSIGFLYWYPSIDNTAEGVSCVLPVAERATCRAILTEAEHRIGRELSTYLNTHPAVAPPPTVTIPPPTTAAAAPGTLTADISGSRNTCLSRQGGSAPTASDTFDLREPGNGLTEGSVLAVAASAEPLRSGCSIVVIFTNITTGLGFYVVHDETQGLTWGPFDARNLPVSNWSLNLVYSTS